MEATSARGTAVVIGASIAGLTAARVLADRFRAVVVLDRDHLPDTASAAEVRERLRSLLSSAE